MDSPKRPVVTLRRATFALLFLLALLELALRAAGFVRLELRERAVADAPQSPLRCHFFIDWGASGAPMRRPPAVPVLAFLSLLLSAGPAAATIFTYPLAMDGAQEVPGGSGDPDGSANGTISLNDVTGEITFEIFYANIDDPGAMHIHPGAAGVEGGPLVTLPVSSIGVDPNPLVGSVTPFLATVQSIIANPSAFYVNIHTNPFPDGAVRGQIPEPGVAPLLGMGLAVLALGRRRRAR